jgi:hypothetical protein
LNDLVNSKVIPFTNIYDKGYHARTAAWKEGEQLVLSQSGLPVRSGSTESKHCVWHPWQLTEGAMNEQLKCASELDLSVQGFMLMHVQKIRRRMDHVGVPSKFHVQSHPINQLILPFLGVLQQSLL